MFIAASVAAIIAIGLLLSRLLNLDWRIGLLTGGAVGICGAAAALTIAALLPRNEETSRWTLFTVVGVTSLSTIAMIVYPIIATMSGLDAKDAGFFFGATIHDVAQVVGAGYAASDEAGDTAALVKMMRVTMLVPVVIACAFFIKQPSDGVSRISNPLPWLVMLFAVFVALNSTGHVSPHIVEFLSSASRWCLIIGIAAMGMRTSFKDVLGIGSKAIALICIETIMLAGLALASVLVRL